MLEIKIDVWRVGRPEVEKLRSCDYQAKKQTNTERRETPHLKFGGLAALKPGSLKEKYEVRSCIVKISTDFLIRKLYLG